MPNRRISGRTALPASVISSSRCLVTPVSVFFVVPSIHSPAPDDAPAFRFPVVMLRKPLPQRAAVFRRQQILQLHPSVLLEKKYRPNLRGRTVCGCFI